MASFNGDTIRPRPSLKAGGKTFSWLFNTGAAATCISATSFHIAFPNKKPRKIRDLQDYIAAYAYKMSSLGIYEIDLYIKG
jgi:hypothetical protein